MKKQLWYLRSACLIVIIILFPCCDNADRNAPPIMKNPTTLNTPEAPEVLIPACLNEKWGYIEKTGKWIINPQFDSAQLFEEGLASVRIGDTPNEYGALTGGKWGYIDKTGKWIINPKFNSPSAFKEGLALVSIGVTPDANGYLRGGKCGYIDKTGKWIIDPKFDSASLFEEGLALVSIEGTPNANGSLTGGKWGYIDKTGKWIIKQQFDFAGPFEEGLASVSIGGDPNDYLKGGKWGYIDKTGKWIIDPQFDSASGFKNGLAAVNKGGTPTKHGTVTGGKWGYIDKTGKWIINPQFDTAYGFENGLAVVSIGGTPDANGYLKGGKWGYIDKTGKWIIDPQFDSASGFKEGLASVSIGGDPNDYLKGAKCGYIDKTGRWIINPQFDTAYGFENGLAAVCIGKTLNKYGLALEYGKWGYIDKTGKWVIRPQMDYSNFPSYKDGFITGGKIDGKFVVFDKSGKKIWNEDATEEEIKEQNTIGSGFYVSDDGHILTNHHVVDNAKEIKISGQHADVLSQDASNDLALLKVSTKPSAVATFRKEAVAKIGEDIFTFGFPLTGLLSPTGSLSAGTVNSLSGISNNVSHMQISIPVQPGNSGGPVLDRKGHVIGVVVGKLNERVVNMLTGHLPENVNFAINAATVKAFLEINNVPYQKSGWFSFNKSNEEIGAEAQKFTVKVECYR